MTETIVAVFDTAAHAAAAVRDLEAAGIPSSAISQHGQGSAATGTTTGTTGTSHEGGFWSRLFGGEPDVTHDTTVYNRSLQGGSTVVSISADAAYLNSAMDILERHNPVDIDERAHSYGLAGATQTPYAATAIAGEPLGTLDTTSRLADSTTAGHEGRIQLSEETLAVGKRAINRGTTRVRRYVVETPIEEQVTLREETVSIERRPVTDDRIVGAGDFSDKVIEMTETDEEAVVAKTARVREEVIVRKDSSERTETIRDTVRREDVEITKDGTATTSADYARRA